MQRCALAAWRDGQTLEHAIMADEEMRKHLSEDTLKKAVDPQVHLKHVDTIFRRVGLSDK